MAAASAAVLVMAAPASQAATVFNLIDQGLLDANGTENFGANIDATGAFDHTFTFNTSETDDASGSVITIRTGGGLKDIDFTAIDLDGVAFTPDFGLNHEPNDSWNLFTAIIGAGAHAIHVHGNVVNTSAEDAASYAGTLNLTAVGVPEPASWALMIMGFGAAGAMIRSRRRMVAA
jgi:hypothetical protein